ncbi:hypothetical protein BH09VER1_BH09VER1_21000 [soil metagenome]
MGYRMRSNGHFLGRVFQWFIAPRVFLVLGLAIYVGTTLWTLRSCIESPDGRADLVSGDAGHYLSIADDFSKGNYSMNYVKNWPHRQPLYPALLATIYWSEGRDVLHRKIELEQKELKEKKESQAIGQQQEGDLWWLALVNVVLGALGFVVTYLGMVLLFPQRWIAAAVGLLYMGNSFLGAQITRHLLTEPLHILLMMLVILSFYAFLKNGRAWTLYLAVLAGGLDYLARPNGLLVTASFFGALVCGDLWLIVTRRNEIDAGIILRRVGLYAGCVLLFAVVTMPSWVPRQRIFGNPIYAGYLNNYLWVDTYKEGHVGENGPRYHLKDYLATHSAGDFVMRWGKGIWNVVFDIPWRTEDRKPVLYLCAWGGVLLAAFRGPPACRIILLFGVVQLLPLIWTNMSNPNLRVPYASTLPFELFFAAVFFAWLAGEEARQLFASLWSRFSRKQEA